MLCFVPERGSWFVSEKTRGGSAKRRASLVSPPNREFVWGCVDEAAELQAGQYITSSPPSSPNVPCMIASYSRFATSNHKLFTFSDARVCSIFRMDGPSAAPPDQRRICYVRPAFNRLNCCTACRTDSEQLAEIGRSYCIVNKNRRATHTEVIHVRSVDMITQRVHCCTFPGLRCGGYFVPLWVFQYAREPNKWSDRTALHLFTVRLA